MRVGAVMNKIVRVGVGSVIIREKMLLFGLRSGLHGKDQWCFPGGHLEFGETPEECAIRETREETGLIISQVKSGPWVNNAFTENDTQYITLFMMSQYIDGEAQVMEENKFKMWKWFPCDEYPEPLFLPLQTLLRKGYPFSMFCNLIA